MALSTGAQGYDPKVLASYRKQGCSYSDALRFAQRDFSQSQQVANIYATAKSISRMAQTLKLKPKPHQIYYQAYDWAAPDPNSPTNTTTPMRERFNNGDRVVLLRILRKDEYKCGPNHPVWGYDDEYIAGNVTGYDNGRGGWEAVGVRWDNGNESYYYYENAEIISLTQAPKPTMKPVILDTSKLDPLIIEETKKQSIVSVLKQHQNQDKLFNEWGLGEVLEYGKGMTFLFYGPPGTGKTWAAHCIAKAVGKELLTIGPAEIQTSEPGGANRAIQKAFGELKKGKKILFLDECDSLITDRRGLGMIMSGEVNTLLTEIEKCEHVCILATNKIDDLDEALERRISLLVEFPAPGFEQRKDIWKKLLPSKMPIGTGVDLEELGQYNLTGGQIKNVILNAARKAISDEAPCVEHGYFVEAIKTIQKSTGLMGKQPNYHQTIGVRTDKGVSVDRTVEKIVAEPEIQTAAN